MGDPYVVATLSFPLPECAEEFRVALDGVKYRAVLSQLDWRLRNETKHRSDHHTDEELAVFDTVRSWLYDCVKGEGVEI
jgi:hypothetical protein